MDKAVLVFDMPKSCSSCKLKSTVRGIQGVTHCCNLAEGMITLKEGFNKRLDNCPLDSMSEYDTITHQDFATCYSIAKNKIRLKLWSVDYAKGYLSCYLNNVLKVSDETYNEYATLIDELER